MALPPRVEEGFADVVRAMLKIVVFAIFSFAAVSFCDLGDFRLGAITALAVIEPGIWFWSHLRPRPTPPPGDVNWGMFLRVILASSTPLGFAAIPMFNENYLLSAAALAILFVVGFIVAVGLVRELRRDSREEVPLDDDS
jgi:hypothetical protein